MRNLPYLIMVAYVAAIFAIACLRPAGAEDDCRDPTLEVVGLPYQLGVLCIGEGI